MSIDFITGSAYGARELKLVAHRYMAWALAAAGLLHFLLVGGWWAAGRFGGEEPPTRTVRVMKYSELGPPPSISSANAPAAVAVSLPTAQVKPTIGVPVPVADEEAPPEQMFPTQEELAAPVVDTGVGTGTEVEQDLDVGNIQVEEPPPDFVPIEKEPQVVTRVEPAYPDAAKQSGIEGSVFAKLWIDKEGKVKDVVILKTPSEAFNQAVIDAAKQWVFTPALMNTGAVAVWFPVKFTFHLEG
ncbi:MAG TPA: TonB family protein [Candidatus Krumholzibacteria bacterium]|nr:TonB family protein [Candidatus Krumholzibacteria bacterium]